MTLLDSDKNNPKNKSNSNVREKKSASYKPYTLSNNASTSKISWVIKSNSSKTNINTSPNPLDLIKTSDSSNKTSTSKSFIPENAPKSLWGMKSNSSSKTNWSIKSAFSKSSKPPDLVKTSESSDKTNAAKSSSFGSKTSESSDKTDASKSASSDQTNTFKSSNSLITSNKQIQLNHESLIDDESSEKKQFSNSIDQSHDSLKQIKHIDDEKFEEPSSNEVNISSQISDYESQILQEYLMTNEDQQMPQYSINNQSLIAQKQNESNFIY